MIKSVLIINNHGSPRLVKFYSPLPQTTTPTLYISKTFASVASRPDSFCNYLLNSSSSSSTEKIIYRHYATLYFIFIVDSNESDLGILDLIQVFVESLDKLFGNVCELDLIFHSDKVHYVMDEIVMGGMVAETNINSVMEAQECMNGMHKRSVEVVKGDYVDYRR